MADTTIFMAWSDEPWVLDGAAVRVSIFGFGATGDEEQIILDGKPVARITSALRPHFDPSMAKKLRANSGKSFMGMKLMGDFLIDADTAARWTDLPNPTGVSNRDVLHPYINAKDVMQEPRQMWVVDFDDRTEAEAAAYVTPFAYLEQVVKPYRAQNRNETARATWWRTWNPRMKLKAAVEGLSRYLVTPAVSKHRVFTWVSPTVRADGALFAFATEEDYDFGVLHSRLHELWSLAMGTSLGVGNDPRYTNTTCFETFPFPIPTDNQRVAIAAAAKHLDNLRNHLVDHGSGLTLTKLYNEIADLRERRDATARAFSLLLAHEALDQAVAAAYGWDWPMSEEELLGRLLNLNIQRTTDQGEPSTA